MNISLDASSFAGSLRFILVGMVIVVLMPPLAVTSCVVDERRAYYDEAVDSVSAAWGDRQRIAGPVLLIPTVPAKRGDVAETVMVMPESLELRMDARHQVRRRGIFEAPVFDVDVVATGRFAPLDLAQLAARHGELATHRARIAIAVSDPRGVREATLRWTANGASETVVELSASADHGLVAPGLFGALAAPGDGGAFSFTLAVRGSKRISAVPVGDRSNIEIASTWPHPSFDGRFLPDRREISADGFNASWSTLHLARGLPGIAGVDAATRADLFADKDLGFTIVEPVNLYASVNRSVKYGVLFVVLTLVSVLCLELATGMRFHIVQYGVAGVALVLFFLTLLALAEHIGFAAGYAVAALLLTGMVAWYAYGASRRPALGIAAAATLAVLYAVLYVLLRLESFALLVGTVVLLAALAMLMRVTTRLTPTAQSKANPQAGGGTGGGA